MRPIQNYEAFQDSLRNFEKWLFPVGIGGFDIDCAVERHGYFLFLESTAKDDLSIGKYIALHALAKLPRVKVLIIKECLNGTFLIANANQEPILKGVDEHSEKRAFVKWDNKVYSANMMGGLVKEWFDWASSLPTN